ncbi:CdaR family protein [Oceanobacillus manasiensis]|uniref:CdaR family protein n=1 Tax=Oceanobacillus manasiensis TaxID=586413 RepID=UPI0005A7A91A|nr:CdaR family protein [Oceanobacillus manasiensis]
MDNWFRSKWFVRVIALALAVLLYIFVNVETNRPTASDSTFPSQSDDAQTMRDVPVEIEIDSDNYVVSGVPESVTVYMQGSPGILTPVITNRNFKVFVDLEGFEAGEHKAVEIQHTISPDIDAQIEPKHIDVVIEEKGTKEFDVTVDFLNENGLAEGYELGDYMVDPSTVTITSAKSVIDRIGIVKVYVDLSGLDRDVDTREVPVNVYDNQGNALSVNVQPENVVVSAEIDNPSKTVPLSVETNGELPEGYSLTSISANVEEIEVYGRSNVLENIETVNTEEIDLSQITESGTIEADITLPDGASAPGNGTIEVSVELEQTRTIESLPIETEGIGDELESTFLDPENGEMNVTISGSQEDVDGITADDFRFFIDLSGLEPGEHEVPISVEGPEGVEVIPEFEQATIEITE